MELALRLPLQDRSLIEASAGTGKTWTIAALYVRLVLGHGTGAADIDAPAASGAGAAFGRALTPREILVVTFTRAATQELVARIRERLHQAAHFFRQDAQDAHDTTPDPFLQQLRAHYAPGLPRERAAWRLACAAEAMDETAIYTIDAWCRQVLQNYASLTGMLRQDDLGGNTHALWQIAAMDFWRNHIYPLDQPAAQAIESLWPNAQKWLHTSQALRASLQGENLPAVPEDDAWLAQSCHQQQHTLLQLAKGWPEKIQRLQAWFDVQLTQHRGHWNNSLTQHLPRWLSALADWANDPSPHIGLSQAARQRLSPAGVCGMRLRSAPLLPEQLPTEIAEIPPLLQRLDQWARWSEAVTAFAMQRTYRRWQQLKAEQGLMDFADLLLRVRQALDSPHGATLRQQLRQQYPVALIDEFQDTSAQQYAVFDTIYRADVAEGTTPSALLLIGDAKQSIYGFRGADIDSFLQARHAIGPQRRYTLDTNFRSTHAVVAAVNHLFAYAQQHNAQGAFGFREDGNDPLPFEPVQANGLPTVLQSPDGQAVTALSLCVASGPEGDYDALAALCAERIVQWLHAPLRFVPTRPDAPAQTLQPGDIAILVHRRQDALRMQRALHQRGLSAVYLSERESVFQSAESRDLVQWLRAVAEPGNVALARAAFATALLAQPLPALLAAADREDILDAQLALLQSLHNTWRQQGVLPMLRQTIHRLDLAARWQAAGDGRAERRMTNLLHVAELLQQASTEYEGEQALIRYLVQHIHHADEDGGDIDAREQTVRLESDAQLIQIVTIHKSKGLEYPLVMLPFANHARHQRPRDAGPQHLREDLRLLYVALTRARHALWVGVLHHKDSARSALAYLAGIGRHDDPWLPALQALAAGCPQIGIDAAPHPTRIARTLYRPVHTTHHWRPLRDYPSGMERHFAIASFSALVRGMQQDAPPPAALVNRPNLRCLHARSSGLSLATLCPLGR